MRPQSRFLVAGLVVAAAALLLGGGCSGEHTPAAGSPIQDVHATARTIEDLRFYRPDEDVVGKFSPEEAYEIALKLAEAERPGASIWDEPTFIVNGCYFFTEKAKIRPYLSGVLVDADSGDAAIVSSSLRVCGERTSEEEPEPPSSEGVVEPIGIRDDRGVIDRTVYTYVLRPGDSIRSPTGEVWRLDAITEDAVNFGPQRTFSLDANPADGLPGGEHSLGNDQLIRLLRFNADRSLVTLEVIYRKGALQDLAF